MNLLPWFAAIIGALAAAVVTPATAADTNCALRLKGAAPQPDRGPGEVVVGAHGGRVEIVHASGLANLESPVEITPEGLAGMSKESTAIS